MEFIENKNIFYKLAMFSFVVYMFFEFYGTALPFQPRMEDVSDVGTGNIINQVVYSLIFLISIFTLIQRPKEFWGIIRKEKILTIFLLFCLLSLAWSIDPFTSVKRFFRIITLYTVTLSLLTYTTSTKDILRVLKPILYIYVFSSVLVSLAIPGALDPQFHTWRGFTSHKNDLGQVSVICIVMSFFILRNESKLYFKIIAWFAVLCSVALLFGSRSMTSITSFMIISGIGVVLLIDKIFKPVGLGKIPSLVTIVFLTGLGVSILFIDPSLPMILTHAAGKNLTFSGRTDLWAAMFEQIAKHPVLGVGYQAFWDINNPNLLLLYKTFVWLPNEAHNGYIDIINQLGIVGISIFFLMLINYFFNLRRLSIPNPWKWFVIAAMIINLQESSFFRPGHLVGGIVIISYLILFAQLKNQKEEETEYEIDSKSISEQEVARIEDVN